MPTAPNVEGLPLWLQVLVSLAFIAITSTAMIVGYRSRLDREPGGAAQTVIASIPDMSAVRQLTDQCRILDQHVEALDATLRDHTHYMRDHVEVGREMCMRLRELKEEIVRSDQQRARGS